MQASLLAKLSPPPLFVTGRQSLFITPQIVTIVTCPAADQWSHLNTAHQSVIVMSIEERQGRCGVITKATTSDTSESSTSLSVIKSVQNFWDNPEDRLALFGFGFAAVVAFWASTNLITAIDKLPLIPSAFELVGILFSSWFIYRYLLFKPDREELSRGVTKWITDILGQ